MTKRIMAEAIVQALFNAPEAQLQDFTHPMRQRFNKLMKQPSAELQESYDNALKILKAHTIKLYDCAKCGHRWASRMDPPIRCAKCKSPYWQTPMKTQPPHDLGKLTEHQRATQGKLKTDHTRPSPGERRGKHGEKTVSDMQPDDHRPHAQRNLCQPHTNTPRHQHMGSDQSLSRSAGPKQALERTPRQTPNEMKGE